ncbi:MAG: hypothetical protein QM796_13975 [Chthoniobacteraceae bacterium]
MDYAFIRPNITIGTSTTTHPADTSGYPYNLGSFPNRGQLLLIVDGASSNSSQTIGANGGNWTTAVQPICINADSTQVRHSGGVNMLFGDFHVEYNKWSTANDPKGVANTTNQSKWTTVNLPY